jgi:hypothetical protein
VQKGSIYQDPLKRGESFAVSYAPCAYLEIGKLRVELKMPAIGGGSRA